MFASNRPSHILIAAITAVVTASMALAVQAIADQDPSTDGVVRQFSYNGVLEQDGQPVNTPSDEGLWIRFSIYDGVALDTEVYQQDINVNVFQGRFTAMIGPTANDGSSLEQVVRAADDLYLGLTLLNDPELEEDDIALSNAQRLSITPYAVWASHATRFNVADNLLVSLNGDTDGDFVQALPNGDLRATGQGRVGSLVVDDGLTANQGQVNTLTVTNELTASQGQIDTLGVEDLVVNGDLNVNGTIRGTLSLTTATRSNLGDGAHFVDCPSNSSPISCGIRKDTENDEDSVMCELDFTNRRCRVTIDVSGGRANNRAACYCMRTP